VEGLGGEVSYKLSRGSAVKDSCKKSRLCTDFSALDIDSGSVLGYENDGREEIFEKIACNFQSW